MNELLRQHGARTKRSFSEMQVVYADLKAQAKHKNLNPQKTMQFINDALENLKEKINEPAPKAVSEGTATPINEIKVEAPVAEPEAPTEEKEKAAKKKDK